MQNHPVIRMLRPGCRGVRVPEAAAPELVRFLWAKRAFPDAPMSPSLTLDALWH
jgi:hypothetical protein